MANLPELERKKLRLHCYDYRSEGFYFITLCVHGRMCLFGDVVNSEMILNASGKMINEVLINLPKFYPTIILDAYIIMPNHIHAIVNISADIGTAQRPSPTKPSLSDILKNFKTYTTRKYIDGVHQQGWLPFEDRLWQRSFYEHIIRNETSLDKIREYIFDNPLKWEIDRENPINFNLNKKNY